MKMNWMEMVSNDKRNQGMRNDEWDEAAIDDFHYTEFASTRRRERGRQQETNKDAKAHNVL